MLLHARPARAAVHRGVCGHHSEAYGAPRAVIMHENRVPVGNVPVKSGGGGQLRRRWCSARRRGVLRKCFAVDVRCLVAPLACLVAVTVAWYVAFTSNMLIKLDISDVSAVGADAWTFEHARYPSSRMGAISGLSKGQLVATIRAPEHGIAGPVDCLMERATAPLSMVRGYSTVQIDLTCSEAASGAAMRLRISVALRPGMFPEATLQDAPQLGVARAANVTSERRLVAWTADEVFSIEPEPTSTWSYSKGELQSCAWSEGARRQIATRALDSLVALWESLTSRHAESPLCDLRRGPSTRARPVMPSAALSKACNSAATARDNGSAGSGNAVHAVQRVARSLEVPDCAVSLWNGTTTTLRRVLLHRLQRRQAAPSVRAFAWQCASHDALTTGTPPVAIIVGSQS